jgi:flagella basal body P-ring formation protein FlgA
MMRTLTIVLVACALAWHALACQVVEGDNITGKDLAAANPLFASVDPNLRISSTPSPGATQILRPERLVNLARQAGIPATAPMSEVCFQRATELLSVETLMPVLRDALAMEGAEIKILDFSRVGVPRGTLEFPRAALTAAGLWRGHVTYSAGRSAPVWAKVQVTTEQTWIEAEETLPAGQPIEARQLVVRKGPRFPFGRQPLESDDLALGRAALRAIQPGVPIYAFMLVTPREVERGDKVKVEVSSGAAVLRFEALAESSGHTGESILVRNPGNGRRFRVRVEARGKVSIKT